MAAYLHKWDVQRLVQGRGDGFARLLAQGCSDLGQGPCVVVLGVTLYIAGRTVRGRAAVDTAITLGAGGLWCWLITTGVAFVLAEHRPTEGGSLRLFALHGHGVSGHAAAAALLYRPLRDVMVRDRSSHVRHVLGGAAAVWALLVGWSRIWLGMHFLWNVALGLAIGLVTGTAAAQVSLLDPSGGCPPQRPASGARRGGGGKT